MGSAKLGAYLTGALTLVYLLVLGQFGVAMILSGKPVGIAMGSLVLAFPVLGVWVLIREFRFGSRVERLGAIAKLEGTWPEFELELRPSGRPIKASADKVFAEVSAQVDGHEGDWHVWFNLSLAYDAAGDRSRARGAMRKAVALANDAGAFKS